MIITYPPRCATSAMTLSIFKISSAFAQAPRAPFGHHGGRECIPGPVAKFSLYSTCSSGGKIAFGRWGSMYFCDVCLVHHIWINYSIWMENSSLSRFRRDNLLSLVIALGQRSVEGIRSCQQSMSRRVPFLKLVMSQRVNFSLSLFFYFHIIRKLEPVL